MMRTMAVALFCAGLPLAAQADDLMTMEEVVEAAKAGIEFLDNDYVAARLAANPDLLLFDVRTEAEFELGRIPGAQWLPRGKAEFEVAETVREADAEIIIYCRTGSRAALVKKALDAQGYRNVSAHEGFETWSGEGRVFETGAGSVRLVVVE
ncbi:MAG: rhodanese-like domain-containing protein [Henriciella sp.]